MKILVLNAGSSSQKTCLYDLEASQMEELEGEPLAPIWESTIDWTKRQGLALVKIKNAQGLSIEQELKTNSRAEAIAHTLTTLWDGEAAVIENASAIDVIGHRVVHGGVEYRQSTLINADVKAAIAKLALFAPVHNPLNLEGIEIAAQTFGNIPQVAVFDTAFHAHLPPAAFTYAIPAHYSAEGIRRYGFHGISHQYCSDRAAKMLGRPLQDLRLITCHLGNGCSLAAIQNGQSIDTTMGFTPLEGLIMGTRSGSIDAGILIHLLRKPDMDADKLDRLLNRESGLLGVSGVSADLRPILAAIEQGHPQAQLALDMYVHSLRSHIGAMLASLGGLDALIFTAGVGENSPLVRAAACAGFSFLGLQIDEQQNNQQSSAHQGAIDRDIASQDSSVRVLVIHTQEDWEIARECWQAMCS